MDINSIGQITTILKENYILLDLFLVHMTLSMIVVVGTLLIIGGLIGIVSSSIFNRVSTKPYDTNLKYSLLVSVLL